jgi:hypothetical protein
MEVGGAVLDPVLVVMVVFGRFDGATLVVARAHLGGGRCREEDLGRRKP